MDQPIASPALPCICARIRRTARRVSQIYDRHLEPYGLTIGQFGVLAQIRTGDAPSIGELAARMVMDPTTLTRTIRPLQVRGLVVRAPDAADRRTRRWAAAQDEGRGALGDEAGAALVAQLDDTLSRLPPP